VRSSLTSKELLSQRVGARRLEQAAAVNHVYSALRFLFVELYKRRYVVDGLPRPRREHKLPDVLNSRA